MNNKLYTKIEGIIDNKIRTPLSEHNGDIKLLSVENNIVKVSFLGSCKGCPGAQMTMETLVERAIKEDVPDIEEVILVNQVDEGLLDVARNILRK